MSIFKDGKQINNLTFNGRTVEKIVEHSTGKVVYDCNVGKIVMKYYPMIEDEESDNSLLKATTNSTKKMSDKLSTFYIPEDGNYVGKDGSIRITVDNLATGYPIAAPYNSFIEDHNQVVEIIDNTGSKSQGILILNKNVMANLPNLSSVVLPKCTNATQMSFSKTYNLKNVNLSALTAIGSQVFDELHQDNAQLYVNSSKLISLPLCSENQIIVDRAQYEKDGSWDIKAIIYNNNMENVEFTNVKKIATSIFNGCKMISAATFPNLTSVCEAGFRSDINDDGGKYHLKKVEVCNDYLSSIYDGVDNKYHNMVVAKHNWTESDINKIKATVIMMTGETAEHYKQRQNEEFAKISADAIDLVQGLTDIQHFKNNNVYGWTDRSRYGSSSPFHNSLRLQTVEISNAFYKTCSNKHIITSPDEKIVYIATNLGTTDCDWINNNTNITTLKQYAFTRKPGTIKLNNPRISCVEGDAFYAAPVHSLELNGLSGLAPYTSYQSSIKSCIMNNVTALPASFLPATYSDKQLTCVSLSNVQVIEGTANSSGAFVNRTAISSYYFPKLKTIKYKTFKNNTSLSTLDLPMLTAITGNNNFNGCLALTSITVDDDNEYFANCYDKQLLVSKDKTIIQFCGKNYTGELHYNETSEPVIVKDSAFEYCKNITSIGFNDLKQIDGNYTFNSCTSLNEIYFHNDYVPTLASTTIFNNAKKPIIVRINKELETEMKTANNWKILIGNGTIKLEFFAE